MVVTVQSCDYTKNHWTCILYNNAFDVMWVVSQFLKKNHAVIIYSALVARGPNMLVDGEKESEDPDSSRTKLRGSQW